MAGAEERANEAAARIMAAAEAEVATARQAAVEEVTARVGEIVLAAAERVIGREIQAADHQDLIDEAIAAVRAESDHRRRRRRRRRRSVNPALQGYLAAMEESLAEAGALGRGRVRAPLGGRAHRHQQRAGPGHQRRVGAGGVPPGRPRRPARGQGPPRGAKPGPPGGDRGAAPPRSRPSFHWLAAQMRIAAEHGPSLAGETDDEGTLGRLGSRNRVSGYAAAVFEEVTVAELEEIEDQLFRFARTVAEQPAPASRPRRPRPARGRCARRSSPSSSGTRSCRPPSGWPPTPCGVGGPATSCPPWTPWWWTAARARGWRVAHVQSADQRGRRPAAEPERRPGPAGRQPGRAPGDHRPRLCWAASWCRSATCWSTAAPATVWTN